MAKNWAICIGINRYNNLPPLNYAVQDAVSMKAWFEETGFDKVYLFTDNSDLITDAGQPYSSQPTYATLKRFLRIRFDKSFLGDGDNLWFFFSGHGLRHADKDYLMLSDTDPDPEGVEGSAISINDVTARLSRCGADNVVLLLDACRNESSSKGDNLRIEEQQGIITIASCSPNQRSYEIEALNQGSFTYALLESLRISGEGNCATVERLHQRLRYRVAQLNQQHKKPKQTPYARVEPNSKNHLILLPKQATLQDIATLKICAYEAQQEGNLEAAEMLWWRILTVSPDDPQVRKALKILLSSSSKSEKEAALMIEWSAPKAPDKYHYELAAIQKECLKWQRIFPIEEAREILSLNTGHHSERILIMTNLLDELEIISIA